MFYPYCWNTQKVVLETKKPCFGELVHEGKTLKLSPAFLGSMILLIRDGEQLWMPVNDVASIRVFKKGRWYSLPVRGRDKKKATLK